VERPILFRPVAVKFSPLEMYGYECFHGKFCGAKDFLKNLLTTEIHYI
jgi:hypothetical protein